jgi:rfaE bifunctional protein kinase chain/domain
MRPKLARMLEITGRLPEARVTVVGDAVLDEFVFGEIARVSREAPVLILEHRESRLAPGGGANAAANLAALGVQTAIAGRIGLDPHGEQLTGLLAARGIEVETLIPSPGFVTPSKTRILAGSPHTTKQQIVRLDRGTASTPPTAAQRRKLAAAARGALRGSGAVLLADYGYGGVDAELVAAIVSSRRGGLITLDSRFALPSYRGVDAATPNLEELETSTEVRLRDEDDAGIAEAGRRLKRRIGAAALLVTRGRRGMTLLESRRRPVHVPAFGDDEVIDVTGAGDTVIATFTAARATGATWHEAAELANVAGGLVVQKKGTATVDREEIAGALREGWES